MDVTFAAAAHLPSTITRLVVECDATEQMPRRQGAHLLLFVDLISWQCLCFFGPDDLHTAAAALLFAVCPAAGAAAPAAGGCDYSAESMQQLSLLSGSLTRLEAIYANMPSVAGLPALTRLQHLECTESRSGEGIAGALPHLTGLTCLVSGAGGGPAHLGIGLVLIDADAEHAFLKGRVWLSPVAVITLGGS